MEENSKIRMNVNKTILITIAKKGIKVKPSYFGLGLNTVIIIMITIDKAKAIA